MMPKVILDNRKDIESIMSSSISETIAGISGILSADKKDYIVSLGRILQRYRGAGFLEQIANEWRVYVDKGLIKDDYQTTNQCLTSLQEIMDFLDNEIADEVRLDLLKKIFLVSAKEEFFDRDSPLPIMYLKTCRKLNSGEVMVLRTVYECAMDDSLQEKRITGAVDWLAIISERSGLVYPELCELYEQELIEKNLISARHHSDRSGVITGKHFRLTDLGYSLCSYIEAYEFVGEESQS